MELVSHKVREPPNISGTTAKFIAVSSEPLGHCVSECKRIHRYDWPDSTDGTIDSSREPAKACNVTVMGETVAKPLLKHGGERECLPVNTDGFPKLSQVRFEPLLYQCLVTFVSDVDPSEGLRVKSLILMSGLPPSFPPF